MLEIIALLFLTRKIGAICEEKGRKARWYKALTVLLWFGCEAGGAVVGIITVGSGGVIYVYALIGAVVGAGISFLIAKSLKPMGQTILDYQESSDKVTREEVVTRFKRRMELEAEDEIRKRQKRRG